MGGDVADDIVFLKRSLCPLKGTLRTMREKGMRNRRGTEEWRKEKKRKEGRREGKTSWPNISIYFLTRKKFFTLC